MSDRPGRRLAFGVFELDCSRRELRRSGIRVRLQEKPLEVLLALLEHPGEEVTRAELREKLWPAQHFADFEAGINTAVGKLRQALGDSPTGSRFVETMPRRGYRFVAPVVVVDPARPSPPPVGDDAPRAGAAAIDAPRTVGKGDGSGAPESTRATGRVRRPLASPRVLAAAVAVALLGAALALVPWRSRREPPRSLAVLPLTDYSASPERYFADGMTEALITELAKIGSLRVIAPSSVFAYRAVPRRLPAVARELGVQAVLEGSVTRHADRFRLTVQLIDTRRDRHLWAETFERDMEDALRLQTELARAVAERVEIELSPADSARLAARRRVDPRAYEAYLLGRYFWNQRSRNGFTKAIEHFSRAAAIDPTYAAARAGLADTYGLMALSGYDLLPAREAMPRAAAEARQALALDETLAEAHASLAWVSFAYDWDFALAEREFRRAIALNPGYATAHQWYSNYLCAAGRFDEAAAEISRARALDPLSRVINEEASWPDYFRHRHDAAVAQLGRTLELDPDYAIARLDLALQMVAVGDLDAALGELERFSALTDRGTTARAYLGYVHALRGDAATARDIAAELHAEAGRGYVPAYEPALVHVGLGNHDAAMEWLERAFEERSDVLLYARVEPLWDPLRGDPRFESLLRRVGVPTAAR